MNCFKELSVNKGLEMGKGKKIFIIDPCGYTVDYDVALLNESKKINADISFLTSDFYHRPYEPEEKVTGRSYFFLRLCRKLRRRANNRYYRAFSSIILVPEYIIDWIRLIFLSLRNKPVIHFQWIIFPPVDIVGIFILKLIGINIVYTAHNPLPHQKKGARNRFIYKLLYSLPDVLILHSESNLSEFSKYYPQYRTKVRVVPFGLPFYDIFPITRNSARKSMGWEDEEEVLVFQGNIHWYKGLDILLEALLKLDAGKKIRLVISGKWSGVDMEEYESLLQKLRDKYVIDIYDDVPEAVDFRNLACGCDAWILPYREATTSFTGMVAIRYGAFLITSDAGSFPEYLNDWSGDWIVPAGDIDALCTKLKRFLVLSLDERQKERERLRDYGEKQFGWKNIAWKTMCIYDDIAG